MRRLRGGDGRWREVSVVVVRVGWCNGELVDGWGEEGGKCRCVMMGGCGFAHDGVFGGSSGGGGSGGDDIGGGGGGGSGVSVGG